MLRLLLLIGLLWQGNVAPPPFMRMPDIHGEKVVFTCEGDLWVGDLPTGRAVRLTRDEGEESQAQFSPDGSQIAYAATYGGPREIYVIPASGGVPRRVTYRNTYADMIDWTPDGKNIVFRSSGTPSWSTLYTVPVAGGYPGRLPLEFASHLSHAPDGSRFVFTRFPRWYEAWFGYEGGKKNDVWVGDSGKREFRRIVETKGTCEFPVWAGERICFVQDDDGMFSIVSARPDGSDRRRLAGPYDVEIRNLQTDGKRLIYEKGLELEVCDVATGKTTPVRFDLASDLMHRMPFLAPAGRNVFSASIGPTGKRVLVETRGQVISVPAKEGDIRVLLAKEGVRYRLPVLSPDAKRLAYISDETREQQLYVAEADGSHPRSLTADKNRQLTGIRWSPDGKWIALTDSETRLRLVEVATGKETEIARGAWWSGPQFDFSRDSKWLVYTDLNRLTDYSSLALYEIDTGRRIRLDSGFADNGAPAFSTDGKWLAFLSRRHIAPFGDSFLNQLNTINAGKAYLLALKKETRSPFLPDNDEEMPTPEEKKPEEKREEAQPAEAPPSIDVDGLYDRLIEIPVPSANYSQIAVVGDRVLLLGNRTGAVSGENTLTYYDLKEKKTGQIAEGLQWFQLSADGKKLLLYNGVNSRVVDATAQTVGPNDGKLNFADFPLRINPVAEWENMYWDAWRLIRDYFYVANLHGADWPAVGEKYAKLLPSVRSRGELNELIRWMLSETAISHAWTGGGDGRARSAYAPQPGFLGIDVEPDASGYYRIKTIFRGDGFSEAERSPLAAPGLNVEEGDFLIEVAGVPAKEGTDFLQGLIGRVGQVVALKINQKPTPEGARTLRIKPVASESRMRYLDWVRRQREYVTKASGGRIGYIHLAAMGEAHMADFIKQYFPQRDKEALIVDVRFNGGGYISTNVINILSQRLVAYFNQRANPQPWTRQHGFFPGPMACLINEFSASNGEEFPHHFRSLGLGPLIGRRTWGGEVGSDPGWPLADGGIVAVPNYGAWTPKDGWIIESRGVVPDVDVESDPNAYARDRDTQMDRAIEILLAELKRHPIKRPVQPPDPVRVRRRAGE